MSLGWGLSWLPLCGAGSAGCPCVVSGGIWEVGPALRSCRPLAPSPESCTRREKRDDQKQQRGETRMSVTRGPTSSSNTWNTDSQVWKNTSVHVAIHWQQICWALLDKCRTVFLLSSTSCFMWSSGFWCPWTVPVLSFQTWTKSSSATPDVFGPSDGRGSDKNKNSAQHCGASKTKGLHIKITNFYTKFVPNTLKLTLHT